MKRLVVVESPTKARTIRNYLPDGFQVEASMGHIRDLPSSAKEIPKKYKDEDWADLGVNVREDFEPVYIIPSDKKKVVKQLRSEISEAGELYIATDEDREGESIGWHLVNVLEPDIPVRRMVFHEITREAIEGALENTRDLDDNLVEAQAARRILDRLVGYRISPLLWRKIAPKLSAGRVQSVAVRVLVLRERERIRFVPASYWDLSAELAQNSAGFEAKMTHYRGVTLASGRDFADETGRLKENLTGLSGNEDAIPDDTTGLRMMLSEQKAKDLAGRLPQETWRVVNVKTRTRSSKPYAPFITSTLQQEANRKLSLSSRRTMSVAQKLYENGHITYMRTDSTNLSKQAVSGIRKAVSRKYGDDFLSKSPRQYSTSTKGAQEAHEAIRPAGTDMKTKDELGLSGIQAALYDLIWKRTVSTQMANARQRFTNVYLEAGEEGDVARFRASGKEIVFPGFFRAYVEGSDDPDAELADRERPLPNLSEGDEPDCRKAEASGHETQAPKRYTEASLVKKLEEEGIGRPSTYASIINTITRRGYVRKNGSQLVPTFTAFAVNNLLEHHFENLVDIGFTADMEDTLDDIAGGKKEATPYLRTFYLGENGLEERVEKGLDEIDARAMSTIDFPEQWGDHVVRVGKYGPYVEGEIDGETATASLPDDLAPGDVTEEQLREILEEANKGDQVLGIHPEADQPVILKSGPYGPYVQLGDNDQEGKPKRVSLPDDVEPGEVDFETGLALINLPRTLGEHPESGKPVTASIGRYGPYVKHKGTFASLKKGDDVLTVNLERALELIEAKSAKRKPQRVLGEHPETGKDVEVWNGRYGPYVKHNGTNVSLPKGKSIKSISLEGAVKLLENKEK